MNNFSIYHIHDADTPNLMEGYIGITSMLVSNRFSGHKSQARLGTHNNKTVAEFLNNNPDVTVTVLQENLTQAEAERLEKLLRPIPNVGLNVLQGGCHSKAFSGSNHPNFGKLFSDETKAKMSKAQSGSTNSQFGIKPANTRAYNIIKLDGSLFAHTDDPTGFAKEHGFHKNALKSCANPNNKQRYIKINGTKYTVTYSTEVSENV